jgi:hypothetical protein
VSCDNIAMTHKGTKDGENSSQPSGICLWQFGNDTYGKMEILRQHIFFTVF